MRLPTQLGAEDDKLLWDNSSVSSSSRAGCGQAHMGGAQRTQHPVGTQHPGVTQHPVGTQQGHGEGGWALPKAAAQLKEWEFLPKAGTGRTGWRCQGCGTAPAPGQPPALILPLLSISHCEPEGTIPAVTVPGQAATPAASLTRQARSDSMQKRAEKEFPTSDFPATRFMACRNFPIQPCKQQQGSAPT